MTVCNTSVALARHVSQRLKSSVTAPRRSPTALFDGAQGSFVCVRIILVRTVWTITVVQSRGGGGKCCILGEKSFMPVNSR